MSVAESEAQVRWLKAQLLQSDRSASELEAGQRILDEMAKRMLAQGKLNLDR